MKKRIALLLSLVLVLSVALCACGSEKDKLLGTWTTTVDLAGAFNEEMAADPEMGEYLKLESLEIAMTLTFNEDDTYALTVDPDSMDAAMEALVQELTDGMLLYFEDMLAEEGVDMDVEEALALMGISVEELVEQLRAEMVGDSTYEDMNSAGKYLLEEGKISMSESADTEPDPAVYNTYTLENGTLTIEAGTEAGTEMAEYLFPMTLTRAD